LADVGRIAGRERYLETILQAAVVALAHDLELLTLHQSGRLLKKLAERREARNASRTSEPLGARAERRGAQCEFERVEPIARFACADEVASSSLAGQRLL
jgi:hypothetical protein